MLRVLRVYLGMGVKHAWFVFHVERCQVRGSLQGSWFAARFVVRCKVRGSRPVFHVEQFGVNEHRVNEHRVNEHRVIP